MKKEKFEAAVEINKQIETIKEDLVTIDYLISCKDLIITSKECKLIVNGNFRQNLLIPILNAKKAELSNDIENLKINFDKL